ncbi:MAG TPA: ribonucleotide-diphosphate reductase subunit beta [Actinomycetota bacterium]|nr:ribonucleotide-diphosphate reductase subunit beta [Actinomycetota bacterium]
MTKSIEDVVREVESAGVEELRSVDIDSVYAQMDHVMQTRPSPLDLYDRWERQQWAVQDLDFSEDVGHWKSMFEPLREGLQQTLTLFFIGEQAVTDTLSPLIMGAPTEEDRVFLTTQIVDEARHTVFFKRFFEEVVGVSGGLHGALETVRPDAVAGFRRIFDHQLLETMDRVRLDPGDYAAWVEGLTMYHLVIEGMLALTGQKFSLRTLRRIGLLPGFYAGFTAVTRDESRHVNYGVGAARDAVARGHGSNVQKVVDDTLEAACWTIFAPDRKFMVSDPGLIPEELRINPREIWAFSLMSLTKRLRVVGLDAAYCASVEQRGMEYYAACLSEYESLHGEEHPVRWHDRQAS